MDRSHQEVARWYEIRIEDGNEFSGRALHSFLKRARLKPVTVGPVMILDRQSRGPALRYQKFSERVGVIGGIVEHLDLQQLARILDFDRFLDQAFDDKSFIVDR
jgi:hypothetical protein